jgi:hypothetical protein
MTLGSQLIHELARRRELGMYFDFAGYRALRHINSESEIALFLNKRGFNKSPVTTKVARIAEYLHATAERRVSRNIFVWLAFDPLGGIIALPLWLLSRRGRERG